MTTAVNAVSSSKDCGTLCADILAPVCPNVSASTVGLFPVSLKAHDSGLDDDDDDDSAQIFRSSPVSVQTSTKESPSPGSSELPSMLSEKGSSRGCSGEGSSGCFLTSEMTDTERSISEGSLSPCVRLGTSSRIMSPTSGRLEDSMECSGYLNERILFPTASYVTSVSSPAPTYLTYKNDSSPTDVAAIPRSVCTDDKSTAFNPPLCYSTPASIYPTHNPKADKVCSPIVNGVTGCTEPNVLSSSVAALSCQTNQSPSVCPNPTVSSIRLQINDQHIPCSSDSSFLSQSPLCTPSTLTTGITNAYDKPLHSICSTVYGCTSPVRSSFSTVIEHDMRMHNKGAYFPHQNLQAMSRQTVILETSQSNVLNRCERVNSSVSTISPPMFVHRPTNVVCSPYSTLSSKCPNHSVDNCLTNIRQKEHYNNKLIRDSTSFEPRASSDIHLCNSQTPINDKHGLQPERSSPVSDRGDRCVTNGISSKVTCNTSNKLASSVYRKRRSHSGICQRVPKRRQTTESKRFTKSDSVLISTESPFHTLQLRCCLQEPMVSLPITMCPPLPIPTSSQRNVLFLTCNKSDNTPFLNTRSNDSSGNKYLNFPLFLNSSRTTPLSESYLMDFLVKRSDRKNVHKVFRENFFVNALRQASVRSHQSYSYSPSSTPESTLAPSVLTEHVPDIGKSVDGRTTPPLFRYHYNRSFVESGRPISPSRNFHGSDYYAESVVFSGSLNPSKPVVCAYCSMQIVEPNVAVQWRLPEFDGTLAFCSVYCVTKYECKTNHHAHSSHPIVSEASLLSDTKASVVLLLQQPIARCKLLHRRLYNRDKPGRRKRLMEFPSRVPIVSSNRNAVCRWNPSRWQPFSKSFLTKRHFPTITDPKFNSSFATRCHSSFGSVTYHRPAISPFKYSSSESDDKATLHSTAAHDSRICLLCHTCGDAPDEVAGRLLPYGFNLWLHLNCILWCYDTYETVSGSLVGVSRALKKAGGTVCSHCKLFGAGLPCFHPDCQDIYHLPCAYSIGCSFYGDRSMYCLIHQEVQNGLSALDSLAARRRIFVSRDEGAQVAEAILFVDQPNESTSKWIGNFPAKLRVGGLILHSVGQLLPEQLASGLFHSSHFIYPVGYCSTRIYWSYRHATQRCHYHCKIEAGWAVSDRSNETKTLSNGSVKFVVNVEEVGEPLEIFEHSTCDGVWQQILSRINQARQSSRIRRLRVIQKHLRGETLYGLTEPHIIRAIESLPGVDRLSNYVFKFGRLQLIKEMPLAINPTGCARSEPKLRTHVRRRSSGEGPTSQHPQLVRNTTYARHLCSTVRSGLGASVYIPASFAGSSKSQQYRYLHTEWRANVVLGRSRIQGLGLYAARDLTKLTFIIEYLGELIRNEVGNRRERLYDSQNRGVYMFRVDDDSIVDATMCGGLARYINHSCEPNCSAEVLNCDGGSHIIIIANRDIEKGEELTYDYKFDIEEDCGDRIPCLCGSRNCRKWMN